MNYNQQNASRSSRSKRSGLILQHLSSQQKANLKKQYDVWTKQAIKQMQTNAITNVTQRIPIMLDVANNKCKQYYRFPLKITQQEENYIIEKVHSELATWKGIQIGTCKKEKNEFIDYSNTGRNWFNRNKAKIYGNHLFYPIIYVKIYQFILDLENISNNQKIMLFVDTLDGILHSTVQFKRSKAHPLIPHQTFIQNNLFRKSCVNLCEYYSVKWDTIVKNHKRQQLANGQYAKNRDRSKDVNNTFISKIDEIKNKILNKNYNKTLPLFLDYNNRNNNTQPITANNTQSNSENNETKSENIPMKVDNISIKVNQTPITKPPTFLASHNSINSSRNNGDKIFENALNKSLITLQSLQQSYKNINNNITPLNTVRVSNIPQILTQEYLNNIFTPPIMNISQSSVPISSYHTSYVPITTNTNTNNYNYTTYRGQNNIVSQIRYNPLTPITNNNLNRFDFSNLNVSLKQNPNGTITVQLQNIKQPQTMQFLSLIYP